MENRAEIVRNPGREWWHLLWPRDQERYEKPEKLVIANATARNSFYIDSDQTYYNIGCTILSSLEGETISTRFVAAVLNSRLLDRWYELRGQTQAETQRKYFPEKVRQIPLRRIHFTTLEAELKKKVKDIGPQVVALVANTHELPLIWGTNGWPRYDATAYRATALGQHIAALLPQDEQGNFLAFAEGPASKEEHSDVVHDLLAELAKQMIELNKQKQAEVKRFLSWLETQLEITIDKDGHSGIDSLANKTILQNYVGDYQKKENAQPWGSFFAVLYKRDNRTRFVNDYWLSDMFRPQLQGEYEKSLDRLLPIKERLARTDALIDQIVYQLYGLTPAEITVIEGG